MLHAIEEGKMKAMYLVGEDMALVDSNANHVHEVLSDLISLSSKIFSFREQLNMLMLYLPAAPSLEKDGTFTNTERRVQRLYQALPTLGDSKAGLVDYSRNCQPLRCELELHSS